MYTNKMRFTGLSGIDTQSMVEQLMKAESMKLYKLERSTQLITWKQEAYRSTASVLKDFQKDFLSFTSGINMRSSASYKNSTSTAKINGTDTSSVKITGTGGASFGKHTLQIHQLASKDVYGSGEFGGEIKSTTDANVAGLKEGDSFSFNLDGVTRKITFDSDDIENLKNKDVSDLASLLQEKVNKQFGENKIKVTNDDKKLSFQTSPGHELKISNGGTRNTSVTATDKLEPLTADATGEFNVKRGNEEIKVKVELKKGMTSNEVTEALNKSLTEAETGVRASVDADGKIVFSNPNSTEKVTIENGDLDITGITGFADNSIEIEHTNETVELGITSGVQSGLDLKRSIKDVFGKNDPFDITINGVKFENIDPEDSVQSLMTKINSAETGVKLSYDNFGRKFSLESVSTGLKSKIEMSDNLKDLFGFNLEKPAADSEFTINNIRTTRESNNIDINGLKMELVQTTALPKANESDPTQYATIDITLESDTSKTLENIKKFVEGYNKIMERLKDDVSTNRVRNSGGKISYEPLLEEEKKAMSETQIKQWEEKAKQGMLYRDDLIGKISSSLRSQMYQSVELESGKKLSLHQIGITTSSNYNDGGQLVIDEDKLKKAIMEHGDEISELFTKKSDVSYGDKKNKNQRLKEEGLAERINDILNDATSNNGTIAQRAGFKSSASEKDNFLYKQLKADYDKLEDMKVYLYNKENYYYTMFSKMEAAITQSNNQMSYLQAQLGL